MAKYFYFSAIYHDDRVQVGGQWFDAGSFAVSLLNQFYEDDKAARLSIFCSESDLLLNRLKCGYFAPDEFEKVRMEYKYILLTLPTLCPFDLIDLETENKRLQELFTAENETILLHYFHALGLNAVADEGARVLDSVPCLEKDLFERGRALLATIKQADRLYQTVGIDMQYCFWRLREFVQREDEAEHLNEAGLFPIALEIWNVQEMPISVRYVRDTDKKKQNSVGREIYFDSYRSFIVTDFFEGLHYGHYPRQCQNCGRYFLMKSARRQIYCDGWSMTPIRGHRVSCRQAGAADRRREKEKEMAADNPIKDLCRRRCACIRSEKSRKTITPEFAQQATALAKSRCERAVRDLSYARGDYETDLQRENLYADVKRGCFD